MSINEIVNAINEISDGKIFIICTFLIGIFTIIINYFKTISVSFIERNKPVNYVECKRPHLDDEENSDAEF